MRAGAKRAGDALGVEDGGDDETETAEVEAVLLVDVEPFLQCRERDAAGDEAAAEHGAGDAGDATEVRECEDRQGRDAPEREPGHRAEVVPRQRTPEPGHERGQPEREHLGPGHADADRGRGPLVGPHREHLASGDGPPQVDDDEAEHHHDDQAEDAEEGVGQLAVAERAHVVRPELQTEQAAEEERPPRSGRRSKTVFLNTKFSIVTANASVTTARLTPRTRSAGIAVRRPKTAATAAPASGPIGKGTFQSVTSFESVKPGDAGQRHLGEGDLTQEPGEDDEREADDGADERHR